MFSNSCIIGVQDPHLIYKTTGVPPLHIVIYGAIMKKYSNILLRKATFFGRTRCDRIIRSVIKRLLVVVLSPLPSCNFYCYHKAWLGLYK